MHAPVPLHGIRHHVADMPPIRALMMRALMAAIVVFVALSTVMRGMLGNLSPWAEIRDTGKCLIGRGAQFSNCFQPGIGNSVSDSSRKTNHFDGGFVWKFWSKIKHRIAARLQSPFRWRP